MSHSRTSELISFPVTQGYSYYITNTSDIFTYLDRLTDLLAKDATNTDPGRVINISSINSLQANTETAETSPEGHGLWSCESLSDLLVVTAYRLV